ncbi:AP-2 complex subunit alpha [[Candida] jaroonii]|uniref:AP-2 complex subunit alpha n=1 Tax=[Candida] jaroonii TaxID=467808 RepID=A0ACA9Y7Z0_9ASCO|nr:AP-2 complex subunit alpha [[Candida] jaroonii]
MKGLTQFIVDIRNTHDQQEEKKRINVEVNNIQLKFNSGLNDYQRRKYISKIVYIYLLGYDHLIEFGTKECLQLLMNNKVPEKQLGYLYLSVMIQNKGDNEQYVNEIFGLTFNQLKNDLNNKNEDINTIAIQFISNNLILDYKFQQGSPNSNDFIELIETLYSMVISPVNSILIKKKAIVGLKNLILMYPQILDDNNWIPRLLNLIDNNQDLSIILNSTKLIEILITLKPNYIYSIIPSITKNLNDLIIENTCPKEFYYYLIPSPWLIIKLFKLLEHCFLLSNNQLMIDDANLNNLRQIVAKTIQMSSKPIKGLPNRNSQNSILFQAVSIAVFLQASDEAITGAINALIDLLVTHDTNTRYLSLDVLIKLIGRSNNSSSSNNSSNLIYSNLKTILGLLNDRDISIKRKTLDLIYIITNEENYQNIINKLIDYYPQCDIQLKSELSIKIAVLSENFAQDSNWYVNIMIKLISIPTTNEILNNEIWERICQILINNHDLHKSTTKLIISKLAKLIKGGEAISNNLIKLSSFIIGEFGPLVKEDYSPASQFNLLFECYSKVNLISRSMILSSFMKMLVNYPDEDFVPNIVDLFELELYSLDLEIQTRANEYLKLFTTNNLHLHKPLPPFESTENHLLSRIGNVDKIVSGFVNKKKIQQSKSTDDDPFGDEAVPEETYPLSPNWYNGYVRMLNFNAGIFFENQLVKITYKITRDGFNLSYKFTIINNSYKVSKNNLTNFKVLDLKSLTNSVNPSYLMNIHSLPEQLITDKSTLEMSVKIRSVVEIEEPTIISLTFNVGGSFNQLNLKIPINLIKTLSPTGLKMDEFKNRWMQINQLLPNNTGEHIINTNTSIRYNSSNIIRLLQRLGFSIVYENTEGILILGAGIIQCQNSKYGCLVSVKSSQDIGKQFEIIIKCTGGGVSQIIASTIDEIFQSGF